MTTAATRATMTYEVTLVLPETTPPLTKAAAAELLALLLEECRRRDDVDAQEAA